MRKNLLQAIAALSLLGSCATGGQPLTTKKADNNRTYNIAFLFEHEGCKIYRFYDFGYVYFANCSGQITSKTDSTETSTIIKKDQ